MNPIAWVRAWLARREDRRVAELVERHRRAHAQFEAEYVPRRRRPPSADKA